MIKFENKDVFELYDVIPETLDISTKLTSLMIYVPSHMHTYYEIFYVVSGTLKHNLNGIESELTSGDCVILTPNDTHSMRSKGNSIHRDILISKNLFESALSLLTTSSTDIKIFLKQLNRRINFSLSEIIECENLAKKFDISQQITQKKCIALTLLLNVLTKLIPLDNAPIKNSNISGRILDCLNDRSCLQGGIPAIANKLKYSRSYLSAAFKKETGMALSIYIKNLRLDYATHYLTTTNYPLRQICDIIGIESLPYFNKIFKEKHSVAPIKYRRQYKTSDNNT